MAMIFISRAEMNLFMGFLMVVILGAAASSIDSLIRFISEFSLLHLGAAKSHHSESGQATVRADPLTGGRGGASPLRSTALLSARNCTHPPTW